MIRKSFVEARRTRRVIVNTPAKLLSAGKKPTGVTVWDISEHGIGVLSKTPLKTHIDCALSMALPGKKNPRPINYWAGTVYCLRLRDGRYRIGLKFLDMDPYSRDCVRCLSFELALCEHACSFHKQLSLQTISAE